MLFILASSLAQNTARNGSQITANDSVSGGACHPAPPTARVFPNFCRHGFPRGVAPSAARTVGRNAALVRWPFRATCAGTPASRPCRPHHCRMHSPLPCEKPDFSQPHGLLRSPRQGKTADLRAGWFQFSPGSRFLQSPFASPVATKPKTPRLTEAPRGFCQPFAAESGRSPTRWPLPEAQAAIGKPPRAKKPWPYAHLDLPKPHLGLTAPRRTNATSANQPHYNLQSSSRFNPLAAQPASPRPAKPFWLRSPLAACSLSPATCGFTAGLSASPLPRPTMASAAGRRRPTPPTARIFPNFCRHGLRGAQPRPLDARLGATPPCCFGLFAPPAPAHQPRGLAARPTAGRTRRCLTGSRTSARYLAFCTHHGRGKLLASARPDFSLAQAAASRKRLPLAR